MISRRNILAGAGLAGATVASAGGIMTVSLAANCAAGQCDPDPAAVSPEQRVDAAIAELKAALVAAHPGVQFDIARYRPESPGLYLGMLAFDGGLDVPV